MKRLFAGLVMLGCMCLSSTGYGQMGMMGMSMARHHFVMMNGIDPQYTSKENPLEPTAPNIESGRTLFEQNCARCHGVTGLGDGPDGANLFPRPANVAAVSKMPMASDGYLLWSISEGGVPVGSAMPPFKGALKEDEIWKIITYLRVL
ncbi:High-affinity iron permease [Caballeronia glathei]|uniref:c-type cytochrome n=1 Tax=Caballeronia glathei TaxID=60547 RepID=UPI0005078D7C|nr:cytochrome c [Caballeronia glathei]CDY74631.1 High-affinity iron permease [Caballeronia glathei]